MSEENQQPPVFQIQRVYLKEASLEQPNSPAILLEQEQPSVDIQLGVAGMPPVDKVRLGVRIGLHYGPVVEREGDVFGDTVNLSARLTEMASRGQIITSLETVERLGDLQRLDCRKLYAIPVKGKEKDVQICEILWTDVDDATQLASPRNTRNERTSLTLRVSYRGRDIALPAERKTLVMGRDAGADLVVAERMASRMHCEIEARQGRFDLTDSCPDARGV